jgi:hypothetical protein
METRTMSNANGQRAAAKTEKARSCPNSLTGSGVFLRPIRVKTNVRENPHRYSRVMSIRLQDEGQV